MKDTLGREIKEGDCVAVSGGTQIQRHLKVLKPYSKSGVFVDVGNGVKWPVESTHLIKEPVCIGH